MSNFARLGLAAALILGSASLAAAQSTEGNVEGAPVVSRTHRATTVRHATRAERQYQEQIAPNYSSPEPWSSSFDPGNTSGGN